MKEYNYQWLFENLLQVRMSKSIFPTFWIGDDDPKEITELKEKLHNIKHDMENIELQIYRLMGKVKG